MLCEVCLAPSSSSLKAPQIALCDRRTYTLCAHYVPRFPGSISQNAFNHFDTSTDASLSLCVQSLAASPSGFPRQPLVIQRAGYMKPSPTVTSCKKLPFNNAGSITVSRAYAQIKCD